VAIPVRAFLWVAGNAAGSVALGLLGVWAGHGLVTLEPVREPRYGGGQGA
jgi:hypothetical protein